MWAEGEIFIKYYTKITSRFSGLVLTPRSSIGNIERYLHHCRSFPIRRNSVLSGFSFSLLVDIHDWTEAKHDTGQARPATPAENKHDLIQIFKKLTTTGVYRGTDRLNGKFLDTEPRKTRAWWTLLPSWSARQNTVTTVTGRIGLYVIKSYTLDDERCSELLLDMPDHKLTLDLVLTFPFLIVFNNDLLVFILCKTSPLVLCSFHDILNILLYSHISKASNLSDVT